MHTSQSARSRWTRYNARPGAHARRKAAREAASIAGNYGWVNGVYYDDLADAVRGLPAPDGEGPPKPGA